MPYILTHNDNDKMRYDDKHDDTRNRSVVPAIAPCTAFCASNMQYSASAALAGTDLYHHANNKDNADQHSVGEDT
jgi:hypothetical protein